MPNAQQLRFLSAGHFFHHYLLAILPVAAIPIQTAWSLTDPQAIVLGTAMYALLGLATVPFGWLGDVWPRPALMTLCLTGSAISAIAAGCSSGPLTLTMSLGCLGLFSAAYHPVGLAMVADYADRAGMAYARNGVWGNVGGGIAAVTTALLANAIHWRMAFILPAVCLLAVAVRYHRLNAAGCDPKIETQAESHSPVGLSFLLAIGATLLAFLVLASIYDGFIAGAVTYTLPRLLEDRAVPGSSLLLVGGATSLILTLGSFAQLISGWTVERVGVKPLLLILFAGQATVLFTASHATGPLLVILMMTFYALLYAWFPITALLISTHVPANLRSRILSLEYLASLGASAATIPVVAWLYANGMTADDQLQIAAALAVLVLVSVVLLPGKSRAPVFDLE